VGSPPHSISTNNVE